MKSILLPKRLYIHLKIEKFFLCPFRLPHARRDQQIVDRNTPLHFLQFADKDVTVSECSSCSSLSTLLSSFTSNRCHSLPFECHQPSCNSSGGGWWKCKFSKFFWPSKIASQQRHHVRSTTGSLGILLVSLFSC